MKYIRTKDGRITGFEPKTKDLDLIKYLSQFANYQGEFAVIKQADTIEELCDEFVLFYDNEETKPDLTYRGGFNDLYFQNELKHSAKCYGAIWTDKGLIYVAKMNEKRELELL